MADFVRPESYEVDLKLTREESQLLTEAARFHGLKLSDYIRQQALSAAALPQIRWA